MEAQGGADRAAPLTRYGFFKVCRVAQKLRPCGLQTVWVPVAAPLEKPLLRLKGAALSAPFWAVYFDSCFRDTILDRHAKRGNRHKPVPPECLLKGVD
jgi:hypothetical protein